MQPDPPLLTCPPKRSLTPFRLLPGARALPAQAPMSTPCGHQFCKACITKKFEGLADSVTSAARTMRARKVRPGTRGRGAEQGAGCGWVGGWVGGSARARGGVSRCSPVCPALKSLLSCCEGSTC